jgi:hypothetical protein
VESLQAKFACDESMHFELYLTNPLLIPLPSLEISLVVKCTSAVNSSAKVTIFHESVSVSVPASAVNHRVLLSIRPCLLAAGAMPTLAVTAVRIACVGAYWDHNIDLHGRGRKDSSDPPCYGRQLAELSRQLASESARGQSMTRTPLRLYDLSSICLVPSMPLLQLTSVLSSLSPQMEVEEGQHACLDIFMRNLHTSLSLTPLQLSFTCAGNDLKQKSAMILSIGAQSECGCFTVVAADTVGSDGSITFANSLKTAVQLPSSQVSASFLLLAELPPSCVRRVRLAVRPRFGCCSSFSLKAEYRGPSGETWQRSASHTLSW